MLSWFDGNFLLGSLLALATLGLAWFSIREERKERALEGKEYPRYRFTVVGLSFLFFVQVAYSALERSGGAEDVKVREDRHEETQRKLTDANQKLEAANTQLDAARSERGAALAKLNGIESVFNLSLAELRMLIQPNEENYAERYALIYKVSGSATEEDAEAFADGVTESFQHDMAAVTERKRTDEQLAAQKELLWQDLFAEIHAEADNTAAALKARGLEINGQVVGSPRLVLVDKAPINAQTRVFGFSKGNDIIFTVSTARVTGGKLFGTPTLTIVQGRDALARVYFQEDSCTLEFYAGGKALGFTNAGKLKCEALELRAQFREFIRKAFQNSLHEAEANA